jgi:hypothetical protein
MAKKSTTKGFNGWPGRREGHPFDRLVSPLGEDCIEHNGYSPSGPVEGAKSPGKGQASRSESAKDQRRG